MPKSGSTFLSRILADVTGCARLFLFERHGELEQQLYVHAIVDSINKSTITQQHTRPSTATLNIMKMYQIRPVIVSKSLFDVIPSILDHLAYEKRFFLAPNPEFVTSLSRNGQIDFIINQVLPWYCSFYASWVSVERSGELDVVWTRYEDLIADWPGPGETNT